ncbi:MAG: type II toxin-antitoxin system ParD family antitoxin [Magnetococcales bacterium]|nr:type II toxin-antitoxin system ParD family antitoxin [Magnetococcales bacterium]
MTTIEEISIVLTQDMAAFVRQAVASGEYASSIDVLREAMQDWITKKSVRQQQIEELGRIWQEGIDSGAGQFGNIESILQEARQRFDAECPKS